LKKGGRAGFLERPDADCGLWISDFGGKTVAGSQFRVSGFSTGIGESETGNLLLGILA
jgi:hypothetical protein